LPPAKNRASGASIHKLLSGPWRATLLDPLEFISRLKIIDKKGVRVNLIPNQEQIEIVQALEEEDEDLLILKVDKSAPLLSLSLGCSGSRMSQQSLPPWQPCHTRQIRLDIC
jgi:hypothetical protein